MIDQDRLREIKFGALTGKGSPLITTAELAVCNDALLDEGWIIACSEAYEFIDEERQPLRVDLSIFDAGYENSWSTHKNSERQRGLIEEIITRCLVEGREIRHIIWIDQAHLGNDAGRFSSLRKLATHCDEYFGERITSGEPVDGVPTDYSTHDRSHWLKIQLHHLVTENDELTAELARGVLAELEVMGVPEAQRQVMQMLQMTGMPLLREPTHFETDRQALREVFEVYLAQA